MADGVAEAIGLRVRPGVTWINVEGLEDTTLVEELGNHFRIDPLLLEDLLHVGQRPKVELRDDYVFLVLRMFTPAGGSEEVRYEQVSMVLGGDFLLTFQEGQEGDAFDAVRRRLREGRGIIRGRGADYLMYALVDTIVDNYFLVLAGLSDRLEEVEDHILESAQTPAMVSALHRLRRENIMLRKAVWPVREMIATLLRGDSPLVHESTLPYLRDVQDHAMEVVETVETLRDLTQSLMEVHLSLVSNRMNEVIKVLTIISTIFVPLTFIVGIYGMNFHYMPELALPWAYPAVWVLMAFVTLALLTFLRRRGWL
ncbi:MAG: magnesium/cobalt transporter CorA [Gemmatimonadota bacterium]